MGLTLIAILTGAMLLPGIVAAHFFYRAGKTGEVEPLAPSLGSPTGIAQVGALSVLVHVIYVGLLWAVSRIPERVPLPLADPYRLFGSRESGMSGLNDVFSLMAGLLWLMVIAVLVGRAVGELFMRASNRSTFYGPIYQLIAAADGPQRFITAYVLTKIEHEGKILGYEGVVENLARDADRYPTRVILSDARPFTLTLGKDDREEIGTEIDWIALSADEWHNIAFRVYEDPTGGNGAAGED